MPKRLSITVPIFNNAPNLPHSLPRLFELRERFTGYEIEYIFVDDGSRDGSLDLLKAAQADHSQALSDGKPDIRIVKLTRNFGAVSAMQAALKQTTGDCICHIAADMQDPPELIEEMLNKWASGKKVVVAVRTDREESAIQKIISNSFYWLLRRFAVPSYPEQGFDLVLMDRQVVDQVNLIHEKNSHLTILIIWLGYAYDSIAYVRQRREYGRSQWTFSKKIKLMIDSFISFSYAPIRLMSLFGFAVAALSFLYALDVTLSFLIMGSAIPGWTSVVVLICFLLGLIMVMLGIVGEYLWRVLDEVRNRPQYVIDQIYQ